MTYGCGDSEGCHGGDKRDLLPQQPPSASASDNLGNTITSTAPAAGPSSWTLRARGAREDAQGYPHRRWAWPCRAYRRGSVWSSARAGEVDASTQTHRWSAAAWTHSDLNDTPADSTGVSCRTAAFCVAVEARETSSRHTIRPAVRPTWTPIERQPRHPAERRLLRHAVADASP